MNDYYTQQPQEDDLVDERWDGFIQEQSKMKEQQTLDNLFQQLAITKELSPPLSSNDKNQQINTSFFREDIEGEEHAYFTRNNSPLNTPLQEEEECDYLTSHAAIQENNNQYLNNDTTPIESIVINNNTTTSNTNSPFTTNMDQYQMGLVDYHLDTLLDMTSKEIIGLPTMYQHYLSNVKHHIYSSLPCTF